MNLKIQAAATATNAPTHTRKANFGSLVSAIRHGDLGAAKSAFDALQSLGSGRFASNSKGNFAAIGEAITSGDPAAAKAALKTFQQSKTVSQPAVVTPADTTAAAVPAVPSETAASTLSGAAATVDILV
jgi:hypothetical protein